MGWWIALAIIVGLAVLPLGVSVRYNADGIYLAVIVGPIRIKILPMKKKEKKPKKENKLKEEEKAQELPAPEPAPEEPSAPKAPPAEPPQTPPEEKYPDLEKQPGRVKKEPKPRLEPKKEESGGSWTDFLSLVPIVFDFLGDFRRKLRVNRLELKLIMAADDPCDLAINYGRAWAALANLLPRLERFLVIQKRDLEVECDFEASETVIIARLDLTITLGRILAAVFTFAFRALVEFLKILKKRKGGAAK